MPDETSPRARLGGWAPAPAELTHGSRSERLGELTSLDYFFERLTTRLVGLTDEEYLWEPVVPCLSIRPGGRCRVERASPDGQALVTTIAWRLCHIGETLREERNWRWMGAEPSLRDAEMWQPPMAADGLAYLTEAYAAWKQLVASVPAESWWQPMGPAAGPYASSDRVALVIHIADELIHHGAEVALLRDLFRARFGSSGSASPP